MQGLNIRYQHWAIGSTLLLVVFLSAAFLLTIFRTFEQMAEERAIDRFSQIASQAWSRFDNSLRGSGRFVVAQSKSEQTLFADLNGKINPQTLVPTFIASLEANDDVYSHFFGLRNDEFLQVIGVRNDATLLAALHAPPGTHFAVRRITLSSATTRDEEWIFLDRQRQQLGRHRQPAKLVPSQRPWYVSAQSLDGLILTEPYLFASNQSLGITVANPLPGKIGVLASDISLSALQTILEKLPLPPNGMVSIQDAQGRVLAFHSQGERYGRLKIAPLTPATEIRNPYLSLLSQAFTGTESRIQHLGEGAGEKFVVAQQRVEPIHGTSFNVLVMAPLDDFLGPFDNAKRDVFLMSALVLLVLLPLAYVGSHQVARALQYMAKDSERLKRLDFSAPPRSPDTFLYEINALGEAQNVMQGAIRQRTDALGKAQQKLGSLVDNGIQMSREQDRNVLLRHILFGARDIAHCAAATLFLKTDRNSLVFALRTSDDQLPCNEIPLYNEDGSPNDKFVVVRAALHHETVVIDDVYTEQRFDLSGTKQFSKDSGFRTVSILTVPLCPREGEVIGLLQLINALDPETGTPIPFPPDIIGFLEALAAQSAIALENHNLIEAQKELMESLIKLIASAIDAKSAYTGGHCERVPELALMLAEEACAVDSGPLADFRFETEDEWREFRIGAWLHDCGKVTTPEYVIDKATKLETIYNRIHEVRMRFEVLLRDAEIERLTAILERREDRATADAHFAARQVQLIDDFVFVAEANVGGEFMAPEHVDRIKRLAGTTWIRHFDDRIGLSQEELRRCASTPPDSLPAKETLLADKPWHVVPRTQDNTVYDEHYGWKVNVPNNLYNFGEVYNLCIERGTLTEEERFKINEHIIQTIAMLQELPLPKHLRRVPEYAGTHHETMIGTGYPRKLDAGQLSIPSRIMAIADIFEALTASDRPYKPTKKLSECIKILSFFRNDKHIDPVLFDLFLTSGVYKKYAERFLRPEQIDEVDISRYVGAKPS